MRQNLSLSFKQTFSTIRRSFLPAGLLAAAAMTFFAQNPFEAGFSLTLHLIFLGLSAVCLLFLYMTNRARPFFGILLGLMSYLLINWLRKQPDTELLTDSQFLALCFVVPLNLGIFYFFPRGKLQTAQTKYILIALLFEFYLLPYLGGFLQQIPYIEATWQNIPLWSALLWMILLIWLLFDISFHNTFLNAGTFYACTCLFLGFIYADSASGLSAFFLGFTLISACAFMLDFYRHYRYDLLENVGSYTAYLNNGNGKFAFKYSIGVLSINERDKWVTDIGIDKVRTLEQLIIDKIHELPENYDIYRYNDEAFIIVFNNQIAKQATESAEEIRRSIAAAEFVFSSGRSVKITVSICISEKTRKYIDAQIVAERAYDGLLKGSRFNNNIVTTVPN